MNKLLVTDYSVLVPHTSSCLVCLTTLPSRFLSEHLNASLKFENEDGKASDFEVPLQQVELEVKRSK